MSFLARRLVGVSILAACIHSIAMAQVIPWQITGTFLDGAPLTGRFDYNAANHSFSNIAMTSGPGNFLGATELMGRHYHDSTNAMREGPTVHFQDIVPGPPAGVLNFYDLFLEGFNPATAQSTSIGLFETVLLALGPNDPSGVGQVRPGQGFAQVIPEPEAFSLMLAGLGLMAGLSVRHKRKNKGLAAKWHSGAHRLRDLRQGMCAIGHLITERKACLPELATAVTRDLSRMQLAKLAHLRSTRLEIFRTSRVREADLFNFTKPPTLIDR